MDQGNKMPALTLTPGIEPVQGIEQALMPAPEKPAKLDEPELTPEEKKLIDDFAEQIDIENTNLVLMYGSAAQKHIADFSDSALQSVRSKDGGEAGKMLSDLVAELKEFGSQGESKGLFGKFRASAGKRTSAMKARYSKLESNVDVILKELERHQITLLKDVAMLDRMFEKNREYFKEISLYIYAGEKKLKEVRESRLAELRARAALTLNPMDAQYVNDFIAMCDRFDKKLYDLKLTRQVSIQMAPQIRLLQSGDAQLVEKIQTTIVSTIPLWKGQMVIALGIAHATSAMQAQRAVTDVTNELLKKNAEALKYGSVEIAKESERGIIDVETLKSTNQTLISTIEEVISIQQSGRDKRREAEAELQTIEKDLKQKLIEIRP